MRNRIWMAAAAALLLGSAPASAATNLLVNGGFEDFGAATLQGWGGYTYGDGYNAALPGWTVDSGTVDINPKIIMWGPAYEGERSLDINGNGPGSISQSFQTELGRIYTLTFAYSRNPAGAQDPAKALVSVAGIDRMIAAPADEDLFGSGGGHMLWQTGSITFTGTGQLETLRISTADQGPGGIFFDDVFIAAPEPATWALMIGGFGMAGAMLRRRSRPA